MHSKYLTNLNQEVFQGHALSILQPSASCGRYGLCQSLYPLVKEGRCGQGFTKNVHILVQQVIFTTVVFVNRKALGLQTRLLVNGSKRR
jgi:hypothetical protein